MLLLLKEVPAVNFVGCLLTMREGKFLEINKKPTNFFLEKDRQVPVGVFKKATRNYEKGLRLQSGETNKWLAEHVIELNPEREKIVTEVLQAANDVIRKYSGKAVLIDRSQIDFFPVGTLKMTDKNFQDHGGIAQLHLQRVSIEIEDNDSNSEIADKVFHELMHLGSLYRMRYGEENPHPGMGNYYPERAGMTILAPDGSTKFFGGIDEALTQTLSIRYLQSQRNNPLYKDDFEIGERKFGDKLKNGIFTYREDEAGKKAPVMSHAYKDEIEATSAYIQDLYDTNKNRFKDVEDVWEVFFQAKFTGRLLQLARLIERTGGKGEFRRLGEVSN